MATKVPGWRPGRKQVIWLVLLLIALYAVLPQFGNFRPSVQLLRHADVGWIAWATAAAALTYLLAALTYCLLALHRLAYGRTLWVQLGSAFADRLLPAGLGGIGVNYAYLRSSKHTPAQAASVVTANNLMGFVGHLTLAAIVLSVLSDQIAAIQWHWHVPAHNWQYGLLLVVGAAILWLLRHYRVRLLRGLRSVLQELINYRHKPRRLGLALTSSICLTLANVMSLYCCARALGISLSLLSALLVFSIGIVLGTLTPTPGGLGGIEAGLVAGLVAVSVPAAQALAIVLLYRLVSYWLAMLVGAPVFVIGLRRGYYRFQVDRAA